MTRISVYGVQELTSKKGSTLTVAHIGYPMIDKPNFIGFMVLKVFVGEDDADAVKSAVGEEIEVKRLYFPDYKKGQDCGSIVL